MCFANLKRLGFIVRRYFDNQLGNLKPINNLQLNNNEITVEENDQINECEERIWWEFVPPIVNNPVSITKKYSKDSFYSSTIRLPEQYNDNYNDMYCIYKPHTKFTKRNPGTPDYNLKCLHSNSWNSNRFLSILDQPKEQNEPKKMILACCDNALRFAYFSVSPNIESAVKEIKTKKTYKKNK